MGRRVVRCSSQDLKGLLLAPAGGRFLRPLDSFDEICPGILLGDASAALSTLLLKDLKVTHVLNAAYGKNGLFYGGYVNTCDSYYEKVGIKFLGIPALDTPSFYLRSYFREAANFIEDALKTKGKVLVHCQSGISRSAALIAAYLMIKKKMDVQQALATIRIHRSIFPNQGFLSQLCDFDYELKRSGDLPDNSPEITFDEPVKDSLKKAMGRDRFPYFTSTNYFPLRMPLSKGGYPISSAFATTPIETRERARSEERYPRSIYDRESSPCPSSPYRTIRSASVIPEALLYQDEVDCESSKGTKSLSGSYNNPNSVPFLSSYDLTSRPYQKVYSYYPRTSPEPFYYTPRAWTKPITDTFRKSREVPNYDYQPSLNRTLTPRDRSFTSSRPYESYTYSSPIINRSFQTYVPEETEYIVIRRPRVYTTTYTDSWRTSTYIPSTLRYPYVGYRTVYTRVY